MKLDPHRNTCLFSIGLDKRLNIIDYTSKSVVSFLKTSNARLKRLELDHAKRRLFASSLEGQVFIFNISTPTPIILYSFTLGDEFGYVKQMQYDYHRKLLVCLTQSSGIVEF